MKITKKVKQILSYYESDCPGTKANLARIMMTGKLGGTGKMVILPVDQGFEHGPARSFAINPAGYDPHYHFQLAIDAGLNAFAAPLGMIEAGADSFAGAIPTILKVNSSNSLYDGGSAPHQATTGSVQDAIRLGCSAIGFTIYPGSDASFEMIEEIKEMAAEAKSCGLAVVVWSYPRGGELSKIGETAIDICAYAAHIAALIGAHIIKVKPPTAALEDLNAIKIYEKEKIKIDTLSERISHVVQSCFNGKRIVIFSGGGEKSEDELYSEIRQMYLGGANGSIIGRNTFQRPREEALKLLDNIIKIYQGKI
ncbi:class I fructose-bisphosphate aldolase [Flavobacteriaceae bacterium]|nr:class I fructose-bisphosphate aldolase [Flavobacteriaceae bacterium]